MATFFLIKSKLNGNVIDIRGGVAANGTPLISWPTDGGDNQLWELTPDPAGSAYSLIQSKLNGNVIDIQGGVAADGTPLIDWPTDGGDNQLWQFIPDPKGSGYSLIQSKLNGNVIDIQGGVAADGTPLIDWPTDGGDNQLWNLVLAPPAPAVGPFSITAVNYPNNLGEGAKGTPFSGLSFAIVGSGQIPAQSEIPSTGGTGIYQVVVPTGTVLTLGPAWVGYSIVTDQGVPTNQEIANSPAKIFVQGPNVLKPGSD